MDKKSFILMRDLLSSIDLMTDDEAGKMFKAIITHVDGDQVELPRELQFAFIPIQNQLNRDIEKYEKFVQKQRDNGAKGGRPKKEEEKPNNPSLSSETQEKPNNLVTDNVTVTDTKVTKSKITFSQTEFDRFWKIYPKKVKRKEVIKKFKARNLCRIVDVMIADVENRMKNDKRWLDGFIPDPTTYVNGDRWEDEVTKATNEKGEKVNWWDTMTGIKEKGEEFGITESRFDSFPAFKTAVFQEAKNRQSRRTLDNIENN